MRTAIPLLALLISIPAFTAPPVPTDDRLVLQLVAKEPEIFTPTGIAVDTTGRIFVIENHTHFRPKDYKGPPGDRVLILDDFADDGHARRITPFAENLKDCMSLAVRDRGVYVVSRNAVTFYPDVNGKAGTPKTLVSLDTAADYPHNGLNGIRFSPTGELYFALGLNVGRSYTLVGSDGTAISGGGEGGSIWRCKPDGSRLSQVATGFWNVHDLTFDHLGRLFAVDNDPDDRPPCRLLDIIEGGDYGWQYRNGRKGIHPYASWFGQRIGTLPMISPTGEAPSGVIVQESSGLPKEYRNHVIATSWGDHLVQHFELKPQGASFTSQPNPLVTGGPDFRPVGIAEAPDGSLVISDWVDRSYAVHGRGRIWRLTIKGRGSNDELQVVRPGPADGLLAPFGVPGNSRRPLTVDERIQTIRAIARLRDTALIATRFAAEMRKPGLPLPVYRELILGMPGGEWPIERDANWATAREDRFIQSAAVTALSRDRHLKARMTLLPAHGDIERVIELLATRKSGEGVDRLPEFLKDPIPEVRRAALQWVGEERLKQFADLIPESLKVTPVTPDVLLAAVAAREKLTTEPPPPGKPPAEFSGAQLAVDFVFDDSLAWDVRQMALRLSDPKSPKLSPDKLKPLLDHLGIEAVRLIAWRDDPASEEFLPAIAADESRDESWRLDAIAGLARSATIPETHALLLSFLHHSPHAIQLESLRALRGSLTRDELQQIVASFDRALAKPGLAGDPMWHEWAEQVLLAAKPLPDALTADQAKKLRDIAGPRPGTEAEWQSFLAAKGDPDAGRRLFAHPNAARCYACHTVEGRGGNVGPDLTGISATPREKIVESILFPSREIAPLYVPIVLTLNDGTTVTGVGLEERNGTTIEIYDATGKLNKVKVADVASRRFEKISIMPEGLQDAFTPQEFRDLVEFLSLPK